MSNRLGDVYYGDYCIEFYVFFHGEKILVRKTSEDGFSYDIDDMEDEFEEEFEEWLEDHISVELTVKEIEK